MRIYKSTRHKHHYIKLKLGCDTPITIYLHGFGSPLLLAEDFIQIVALYALVNNIS